MKKIFPVVLLLFIFAAVQSTNAQESAAFFKKRITVGVDVFTDFWTNVPADIKGRTINQSANVYALYNFPLGEKKTGKTILAVGLGIGNHSFFSKNGYISDIKADTVNFIPSPSDISMKKSKITVTTLDIPLELKVNLKKGFHFGVGIKINYLIDSKQVYIGSLTAGGPQMKIKSKKIYQINQTGYTPTLRFGYKSFNIYAAYQIVPLFRTGHGPAMHPISLGITITPF